jgi:Carboxypeptidase regulatory-like domain
MRWIRGVVVVGMVGLLAWPGIVSILRFTLWVREGVISVVATAEGYVPATKSSVAPGLVLHLSLMPASTLAGRVVAADGRTPIPHARVEARSSDGGSEVHVSEADEEGRFACEGLAPGHYGLEAATATAHGVRPGGVAVGLAEHVDDIVITTAAAVAVRGHVLVDGDPSRPCPEGRVLLRDGAADVRGEVGKEGAVELFGVLPGRYAIDVFCEGYLVERLPAPITVGPDPMEPQVWVVSEGLAIRGLVLDEEGRPVVGATVRASPDEPGEGPGFGGSATADEHGAFEISGLCAGAHTLHAEAPGMVSPKPPLTVGVAERTASVEIRMSAGAEVRGRVLAGDRPLAGVAVHAKDGASTVPVATTDDRGEFALVGVTPGELELSVVRGATQALPLTADSESRVLAVVGQVPRVELRVAAETATLRGRVVDADGGPVGDGFVQALAGELDPLTVAIELDLAIDTHASTITGPDGGFVLESLAPGPYTLVARRRGSGEQTTVYGAVADGPAVVVTLVPPASFAGRVLDASGRAPSSMFVSVLAEDLATERSAWFSAADGAYGIDALPPGRYHVSVQAAGQAAYALIELAAGQDREGVDLRLAPAVEETPP